MAYLRVNGVDLSPYIQTMADGREPLWSSNAGRTMGGEMVGDVIGRFWTLKCTTRPLSQSESAIIYRALESEPFFLTDFIPPNSATGEIVSKLMYVSPSSVDIYSYNPRLPRYKSMSFELIAKVGER